MEIGKNKHGNLWFGQTTMGGGNGVVVSQADDSVVWLGAQDILEVRLHGNGAAQVDVGVLSGGGAGVRD